MATDRELLAALTDKAFQYDVDPLFARKIAWQESRLGANPMAQYAVSSAGAIGPMQLLASTARDRGVNPYVPLENIEGGVKQLSWLRDRVAGPGVPWVQLTPEQKQEIAGAYNAGIGTVQRLKRKYGPSWPEHASPETIDYLAKVIGPTTPPQIPSVPEPRTIRLGSIEAQPLNLGRPTLIPFYDVGTGRELTAPEAVANAVALQNEGVAFPAFISNEEAGRIAQLNSQAITLSGKPLPTTQAQAVADYIERLPGLTQPESFGSLRTAPSPSVAARAYSYLNPLPARGVMPGETEPAWQGGPGAATLALTGLLGLSGAGTAVPAIRATVPLVPTLPDLLTNLALGTGGSIVGSRVGERAGRLLDEDIGAELGAEIGGVIGALPNYRKIGMTRGIVPIPPEGLLKGTKVLTRQGKAQPVFHGTQAAPFEQFDPQFIGPRNLYGEGFYFTTEAENVASGYAGGHRLKALARLSREIKASDRAFGRKLSGLPDDIVAPLRQAYESILKSPRDRFILLPSLRNEAVKAQTTDEAQRQLASRLGQLYQDPQIGGRLRDMSELVRRRFRLAEDLADVQQELERSIARPNIRPVFLKVRNPLDIDKPLSSEQHTSLLAAIQRLSARLVARPGRPELDTKARTLNVIVEQLQDALSEGRRPLGAYYYSVLNEVLSKADVNRLLQNAGFDGITHIGGKNVGNVTHRVWIAFKPEQIYPAFTPELAELQAQELTRRKIAKGGTVPRIHPQSLPPLGILQRQLQTLSVRQFGKGLPSQELKKLATKALKEGRMTEEDLLSQLAFYFFSKDQ